MKDDAISRQAAIDAVSRGCQEFRGIFAECEKNLNELPPTEPKRDKGKWIILKHSHNAMCSNCHRKFVDAYDLDNWDNYCRHCGAIMEDMITEEEWDGI